MLLTAKVSQDSATGSLKPKCSAVDNARASRVLFESKSISSLLDATSFEAASILILLLFVTSNQFLLLGIATKPPTFVSVFCLNNEDVIASNTISPEAYNLEFFTSISLV